MQRPFCKKQYFTLVKTDWAIVIQEDTENDVIDLIKHLFSLDKYFFVLPNSYEDISVNKERN